MSQLRKKTWPHKFEMSGKKSTTESYRNLSIILCSVLSKSCPSDRITATVMLTFPQVLLLKKSKIGSD